MKKLLKVVLALVGVVVVLVGGAFAAVALFVDLDKVVNDQIAANKPAIEAKLGRSVSIGKVTTAIFPTLGGHIADVSIAGNPNNKDDDRPLLSIGSVGFEVSLWDALVSGGKNIHVKSIYLDGLKVNLIRSADGTLSYQDILDRLAQSEPAQQPAQTAAPQANQPLSPDVLKFIQGISIGEIRLGDAELRLVDHATATGQVAESFIKHLNVELRDVRLSDPIKLHVDAEIFADAKNFDLDTAIGPLPQDLQIQGIPTIGQTALKMTAVDLSRIAPYLGKAVPARIDSAEADADLNISGLSNTGKTDIDGFLEVKNIKLAGGEPFDFRIDSKLTGDMQKLSLQVQKLEVKLGAVELTMAGALNDLATKPSFDNFTIHSTTLAPGLLFAYYPPAKANLPPNFKLAGAASLDVKASGDASKQTVQANLNLADLDIDAPGTLVKPKGVPLGVKVDGDFTANDANLRGAEVIVDQLDLKASGTVKNFAQPALDLTLAAPPFSFDRIANLAPSLHEALAKQHASAQGQGRIDGHVKGSLTDLDAALTLALSGVHLDAAGTKLDGSLALSVAAKGDPAKNLTADASVDGQGATIVIPGTLNKAASTPMRLTLHAVKAGPQLDVKQFDVKFAELDMSAAGTFDMAHGQTTLAVKVAPLDLERFARTVTAIPAARAKGGKVDVKVAVKGNPNQLSSMSVSVDPLDVRYAGSDLRGSMQVHNLDAPDITMKFTSNKLDLDAMTGAAEPESAPAKGKHGRGKGRTVAQTQQEPKKHVEEVDNPALKKVTFAGNFSAKELIYSQTHMTNFRGVVHLKDGLLTLDAADFGVFGGTVSAKGTTAEIWRGRMPFHAKLQVHNIDVNQALSAKTKYKNLLQGRGDFDVDLQGKGFETAELEQALTGNLDASMKQGKYNSASLTQAVVGGFAQPLSRIPGMKFANTKADNTIKDLVAAFVVKDGKMNLKKPMSMQLDGSHVTLDGGVGIAGGLFFTGTYGLPGARLTQATRGKCKVNSEVPIPVKINGTVSRPEFRPDVGGAAGNVATACLSGRAGQIANQLFGKAAGQATSQVQQKAGNAVNNVINNAGGSKGNSAVNSAKNQAAKALGGLHF